MKNSEQQRFYKKGKAYNSTGTFFGKLPRIVLILEELQGSAPKEYERCVVLLGPGKIEIRDLFVGHREEIEEP